MNTQPTTARRSASTGQTIALVAGREITSKLSSRAFQVSTILMFLFALAAVIFGGMNANNATEDKTPVAVTADAAHFLDGETGLEITPVGDVEAAKEAVTTGTVDAAIVTDDASPTGFAVIADTAAPEQLLMQLALTPTVELLHPDTVNPLLRYLVAIGFGILFLLAAQLFGTTIATSVIEEKQTRVVEILLSSMPSRALLAGKIIGNTVLAMGQIVGLVAIAVIGLAVTGQGEVLTMLGSAMVWFAIFFLFGFILLASLFAAAASMVSRQEDVGATTFPLTMLIMIPYMLVIIFNDDSTVLRIMSYVPFSAPVGMPMRLFLGEAAWWEPLVSLAILLVSCVAAILVAAKIYDNSLLRMGARVKLMDALRG